MAEFGVRQAKEWMKNINLLVQTHKGELSELDQSIGDGDHGLNMSRGFQEVLEKVGDSEYSDLGSLFKDVAMTLITKVGGASGPLYGSAFLKASQYAKEKETLSIKELGYLLQESLEAIKLRGKAQIGDKTMVDVWEYAPAMLFNESESLDWDKWIVFLKDKMEHTGNLEARKGRAAYLGERSIGHIDPGAFSSYLIFKAMREVFKNT
ncbi:dihydroxyacetone kinase subunit DhaL [Bacillus sp. FJAT-50079]|uniref:dihydroxyacetone kinase subunit DhaL n=1 Tax=Bacillus sp. FJAT-50079 TaxID=2833577 RepID=UPI001BC906EF|nr:dihydroxyacetone kinase subunit DhaL [Bacillus sp. FJAT-50079]MBS4210283.1 dihydroxyacetone kinase subunit L [Bacillus sp. FJAT-50079]